MGNFGWILTFLLSVNVVSSLFQLGSTVWSTGTSDVELLLAFGEKQSGWHFRLLGIKTMVGAITALPFQLKFGQAHDAYLMATTFLLSGLAMLLHVSPSSGIHKTGLCLKYRVVTWDTIQSYRWIDTGTLEVNPNPGFFSLRFRGKLEIPAEFVADVQAMLDSQCPGRQITDSSAGR